jgi:hypothetical protein
MASLRETIQKLDAACRILAAADKSLHDRLEEALPEISSLKDRDFNPDFRKDFQQLSQTMGNYRAAIHRPDLEADIALAILELCIRVHKETQE